MCVFPIASSPNYSVETPTDRIEFTVKQFPRCVHTIGMLTSASLSPAHVLIIDAPLPLLYNLHQQKLCMLIASLKLSSAMRPVYRLLIKTIDQQGFYIATIIHNDNL